MLYDLAKNFIFTLEAERAHGLTIAGLKAVPMGPAPASDPVLATTIAGLDFVNPIDNAHPLNRLYISGFASSGVAVGDVDADGLPDLYLTRGPGANRLYRQTAAFKFEDITERAGVALADTWSSGAAFADVNANRVRSAIAVIVVIQGPSQPPRLDANEIGGVCFVYSISSVEMKPYGLGAEVRPLFRQRFLRHVNQEFPKTRRVRED